MNDSLKGSLLILCAAIVASVVIAAQPAVSKSHQEWKAGRETCIKDPACHIELWYDDHGSWDPASINILGIGFMAGFVTILISAGVDKMRQTVTHEDV